eukprot:GFYU01000623.1.p2 GENE.GFYU01000623.1~~GFYU01000623.1.p2  ORF type:complete len:233 (-),score=87.26 GFYU01000623.1:517-1215(-)
MNDQEVKRQINHMADFIKQEAEEKAYEIMVKAEEEYNIERTNLINEEKTKIRKEFERKRQNLDVQKKIAYSNELQDSRLKVLKARDDAVQAAFEETKKQMLAITNNAAQYKQLLIDLTLQGMMRLNEADVSVRCRECDVSVVTGILPAVSASYKTKTGKDCRLTLEDERLPPPPSANNQVNFCSGGVVLIGGKGKITCSNTLDSRLEIACEQLLPEIRIKLFGRSLTRTHMD